MGDQLAAGGRRHTHAREDALCIAREEPLAKRRFSIVPMVIDTDFWLANLRNGRKRRGTENSHVPDRVRKSTRPTTGQCSSSGGFAHATSRLQFTRRAAW